MNGNWTRLFLHTVWSTWDRLPLIVPELEPTLHAAIADQLDRLHCDVLAIDGVKDHVHVVFRLHADVSISKVVGAMKGGSSRRANEFLADAVRGASGDSEGTALPHPMFRWQGGYSAVSVDHRAVQDVVEYVHGQKRRHAEANVDSSFEPRADTDDAT